LDASLVKGSGGIFEVSVNGRVVASRKLFMFPSEEEIVLAVKGALPSR
jgi:predicted Rdx family selenoprotein